MQMVCTKKLRVPRSCEGAQLLFTQSLLCIVEAASSGMLLCFEANLPVSAAVEQYTTTKIAHGLAMSGYGLCPCAS